MAPTNAVCATCGKATLRRISRRGAMQNLIYPLFGRYPWRCKSCGSQFILKERGARRPRSQRDESDEI